MAQFEHINLEALVVNQYGDIKVVDDYNLTYGRPSPLFGDVDPYSDGGIQIFRAFCAEKGVTYYAAPREEFFEHEAYEKAQAEGNTYLIMEDLS
jgi:hypothetical protein